MFCPSTDHPTPALPWDQNRDFAPPLFAAASVAISPFFFSASSASDPWLLIYLELRTNNIISAHKNGRKVSNTFGDLVTPPLLMQLAKEDPWTSTGRVFLCVASDFFFNPIASI